MIASNFAIGEAYSTQRTHNVINLHNVYNRFIYIFDYKP